MTKKIDREKTYIKLHCLKDWPNEQDDDYAENVLRARYYQGVRSRAESYCVELRAGSYSSEDAFREQFEQAIDGDQDVIYTRRAECVAYVSDYREDAKEEVREVGSVCTPELIAYFCLCHEVYEAIEQDLGMSVAEWFEREDLT